MVLIFFTFCYIIIDEGMMMVNAELKVMLRDRKNQIEREFKKKRDADQTLDRTRTVNFRGKID